MASYSSSRGRSSRFQRRNRTGVPTNSVHSIDDEDNQFETTCIDLTEDSPTEQVIDLTRGYSIIDSPVVVLTSTDNIGPVRQRGSGRNGRRRSRTPRSSRLNTISVPEVHILHSDESSDELPDVPFELPRNVIAANESILNSPAGVKISCPICLDDVKQTVAKIGRSSPPLVTLTLPIIRYNVAIDRLYLQCVAIFFVMSVLKLLLLHRIVVRLAEKDLLHAASILFFYSTLLFTHPSL